MMLPPQRLMAIRDSLGVMTESPRLNKDEKALLTQTLRELAWLYSELIGPPIHRRLHPDSENEWRAFL